MGTHILTLLALIGSNFSFSALFRDMYSCWHAGHRLCGTGSAEVWFELEKLPIIDPITAGLAGEVAK